MHPVAVLLVLLALSACSGRPSRADAAKSEGDGAPIVWLEEVRAIPLPLDGGVLGVAVASSGDVAAWSPGRFVVVHARGGVSPLPVGVGRPVAASYDTAGALEVVDGDGGRIHRIAPDERPNSTSLLNLPIRVESAARFAEGWALGGTGEDGRYQVYGVAADEGARLLFGIDADTLLGGRLPAYRLDPWSGGVLLTEAEQPFRTWRIRWSGGVEAPFRPRWGRAVESGSGDRERWVSLAVAEIGAGFLTTLADLGSDRRVLVLIDGNGRTLRSRTLSAPVGLAGTTPDRAHAVAVRQAGGPEVVLYRWRWIDKTPEPGADG